MMKVSGNSEEKWWVALCKIQRSQAWHISTLLKKKSSCPELSCISPSIAHPMETFLCNPPQSRQRESLCCSHAARAFPAPWVGEAWALSACLQQCNFYFLSLQSSEVPFWRFSWVLTLKFIWILFFEF